MVTAIRTMHSNRLVNIRSMRLPEDNLSLAAAQRERDQAAAVEPIRQKLDAHSPDSSVRSARPHPEASRVRRETAQSRPRPAR